MLHSSCQSVFDFWALSLTRVQDGPPVLRIVPFRETAISGAMPSLPRPNE
jgi:hypothetical protein